MGILQAGHWIAEGNRLWGLAPSHPENLKDLRTLSTADPQQTHDRTRGRSALVAHTTPLVASSLLRPSRAAGTSPFDDVPGSIDAFPNKFQPRRTDSDTEQNSPLRAPPA